MNAAALRRAVLVTLVGLSACGGGGGEPSGSAPAWVDYSDVALDANGQSAALSVPVSAEPGSPAGLLIEVASAPFQCVQVDTLHDAAGHVYVGPPESGPYCLACEQRSSVAAGGGLFAFPSRDGPFQPVGALQLRLGLRDCDTLTRGVMPAAAQRLSVRVRRVGAAVARGRISLRLLITPASAFHTPATDATLDALLAALNAELASAQITAHWSGVTRLPADAGSDAAFSRADPGALQALLRGLPAGAVGIPVVLAGCLHLTEPALGRSTEPQGYTPHIPGGAGPADGIFIQGSLCGTPGPVRVDWSPSALARVMAHELGHYLGLYHALEADGSTDQLDDTGAANLMFHRPGSEGATGLSPTQAVVMRAHPAVDRLD